MKRDDGLSVDLCSWDSGDAGGAGGFYPAAGSPEPGDEGGGAGDSAGQAAAAVSAVSAAGVVSGSNACVPFDPAHASNFSMDNFIGFAVRSADTVRYVDGI